MDERKFLWRTPKFTYADALSGARLVMLPYLLYSVARGSAGLAVTTFTAMAITDLIDGHIARKMGQSRDFGAVFDSTIDYLVIYSLFTMLFAVGVLPWWKWVVIFVPGLFMGATQILYTLKAPEVAFAPAPFSKPVGQIQYVYLPFLLARRFWLSAAWAQRVDHAVFLLLAIAIVLNTWDHAKTLRRLLAEPSGRMTRR
jgi:phosphatidylglycerophosphate synthase